MDLEKLGLPTEEVMRMLSQEALRQAMLTVRRQLLEFAESPMVEGLTGKEAMIAFANAMQSTSNSTWGAKQ